MKLLQDKVALITGGSRGIGRAIALKYAEEGANVCFTYLSSEQKAKELEQELQAKGVQAKAVQSDASSFTGAEALVAEVLESFGKVDILINNAGITRDNLLLRITEDQWNEVIQTNLNSVFNLTKMIIKPMMRQRAGSIINMSSVVGVNGNAGQANYAASKAGIIGFSKSIAQELGSRNIRCNVIAPGFIETDMTEKLGEEARQKYLEIIPLKRMGTPDEVAQVAVFLASDLSSYVSGQVINVCGAMSC